ncbi:alpha/beta fold hydrolase [Nocardiopsis metallicus]|uniref:Pimeloyl-ACP methyl ester carboxylesterase n=1 Tax=Nocardiopsis metallicus TaxID=179819 RepID=A0A840WVT9_9ACTN|nr:alpha/beta hydrolase [Nocardiopsis metallicus]MBB5495646.1 pimeloyl-ACP methyl ester carboxylesterase [Nocardiopsis metallicus]
MDDPEAGRLQEEELEVNRDGARVLSRWIHREGTDLHVLDTAGAGPPVVILHGLAGSAREFWPTARALAPLFRVLLVDQRGHGRSTSRPADTSREAFVADTVAVIEELADSPVRLVGHSMGAHTAMLTASARPDLVERLTLLECHPGGDGPETATRIGAFLASWPVPFPSREAARAFLGPDALSAVWVADLVETPEGFVPRFDPAVMEATMEGLREPRWSEWEGLRVPTLAVFAEFGIFTDAQTRELTDRRPATRRADLEEEFHDAHLIPEGPWLPVLKDWLTSPL